MAVVDLTLSLDTGAYADGDVLADVQDLLIDQKMGVKEYILQSLVVLDESDQGQAMDLLFLNANNSLGTENLAASISDANARAIVGRVPVAAGDFYDLGGCRLACLYGIGLQMETLNSRKLYLGAISRGTGTYAATGIRLKLGFL